MWIYYRDAETQAVFLCQKCGQMIGAEKPNTCPNCGTDGIKEY